ncbi:hypothetical protein BGZ95_004075, partial [Linnemannia exigua]
MSSSAQSNSQLQRTPTSTTPRRPELNIKGQSVLSLLQQTAADGRKAFSSSSISDAMQRIQISDAEYLRSLSRDVRFLVSVPIPIFAQPRHTLAIEYETILLSLKSQRMADYNQVVHIPPMAKPSLQAAEESLFPLMDKAMEFLAGDGQVMLIMGDSGAGKSTFNRRLEYELWRVYRAGGAIPLFINLPALDRPDKELFVLICDGYDESQATSNLHTTNLLNQPGQWSAKLIITCRTQYLGPDYRDRFVPKMANQYHSAANDLFQEAVIAPFSKDQIETYVERYVPLEPRTWVKKDYMDKLTTIPDLMDLVKNPFLLTLCLEALPRVVQGRSDLSRLRVTRVQLYDTFVEHWLGVNKRRLQDQKLDGNNRMALEILLTDGFERNGILYQVDLAAAIFQEQEGRPIVDYSHLRDRQTWKARFFGVSLERSLLRDSSLLNRAGTQHRFIHRSVLEYFYSCTICLPADNTREFDPHVHSDFAALLTSITTNPLSLRSLVAEHSILRFLSERVQSNSDFKKHLSAIVELSKTDEQAARAAANAITILVRAGVHFNGADLQGIRIPGADVSGGQFDSAQLQGSNLSGVNFTKCWIRQANFSHARMKDVLFGELPYVVEKIGVTASTYSPDGKLFAVGRIDGVISIYDTSTWAKMDTYNLSTFTVSYLAFSPTSPQLMSYSDYGAVLLWDCKTGSLIFVMGGDSHPVSWAAFSPCGRHIVTTGCDSTVTLRDAQTGTVYRTLPGSVSPSWVQFSPDGQYIASSGRDGT